MNLNEMLLTVEEHYAILGERNLYELWPDVLKAQRDKTLRGVIHWLQSVDKEHRDEIVCPCSLLPEACHVLQEMMEKEGAA